MANWKAGVQDAVGMGTSGAVIGASVGGPWGAAAGGVIGGVVGGLEGLFGGGGDNGMSDEQKATMQQQQQEQQTLFNEGQSQLTALQNPTGQYGQSLDMLQSAAAGNTPSQAQILMQSGLQEAEGGMMGAAAANNGVSPALALRNAMLQAGHMALQGVSQNAALRASEMASARSQYASAMQANQQMQAGLVGAQAGNAAQMYGQASGNATQLAMPGTQAGAQFPYQLLGGTMNAAGSIGANWAQNDAQQQAQWAQVAGTGGQYKDPVFAGGPQGRGGPSPTIDMPTFDMTASGT